MANWDQHSTSQHSVIPKGFFNLSAKKEDKLNKIIKKLSKQPCSEINTIINNTNQKYEICEFKTDKSNFDTFINIMKTEKSIPDIKDDDIFIEVIFHKRKELLKKTKSPTLFYKVSKQKVNNRQIIVTTAKKIIQAFRTSKPFTNTNNTTKLLVSGTSSDIDKLLSDSNLTSINDADAINKAIDAVNIITKTFNLSKKTIFEILKKNNITEDEINLFKIFSDLPDQ
jgi:hypothetical protein